MSMIRLTSGTYFGTPSASHTVRGLRVTRTAYAPLALVPPHYHDQPYLCLVTSGTFEERSRSGAESCGAGSVVWHGAGEWHQDGFRDEGGETTNLELDDAWVARICEEGVRLRDRVCARGGAVSWIGGMISAEVCRGDDLSPFAIEGLVCGLIAELARVPPLGGIRPPWLHRTLERLNAEFRHPPSVEELAIDAGVHRSHLVRAFSRHVGCSMGEYIRRLRIDWASARLRSAQCPPLSQLALTAGFADQAHFTRTFKRVTGETPMAFRRLRPGRLGAAPP